MLSQKTRLQVLAGVALALATSAVGCSGGGMSAGGSETPPATGLSGSLTLRLGGPGQVASRLSRDTTTFHIQVQNPQTQAPLVSPTTVPASSTTVNIDGIPTGPALVLVDGFNAQQVNVSEGEASTVIGTGANSVTVTSQLPSEFLYIPEPDLGQILEFSVDTASGSLTPLATPSIHSVGGGPDGTTTDGQRRVYVTDLFSSQVEGFSVDSQGQLASIAGALQTTGPVPQSPVLNAGNQFLYVLNGNAVPDLTVSGFAVDSHGNLSPLPFGSLSTQGSSGEAGLLRLDPKSNVMYATNTASQSLTTLAIAGDGSLSVVGTPLSVSFEPNDIAVSPISNFAYTISSISSEIQGLSQASDGGLQLLGPPQTAGVGSNIGAIDPTGQFMYVGNLSAGTLSFFRLDATTGAATLVSSTIPTAGTTARFVEFDPSCQFLYTTDDNGELTIFSIADDGTLTLLQSLDEETFLGQPVFVRGAF